MTVTRAGGRPWYRQFWPWFLIVLPGSAVVASLFTLVIANRYADDLVVDDYYREGLGINKQLELQAAARARALTATFRQEGRQLQVILEGRVDVPQLRLLLSHPMDSSKDLVVPLQLISTNNYQVRLPQALSGRWHWRLDEGATSVWRLDGDHLF